MEPAIDITVNGVKISPETIRMEIQYHSANSYLDAKNQTIQALVIKELLLQEASNHGIIINEKAVENPDVVIDALLEKVLEVSTPDETTCRDYYGNNLERFVTSPLFQVSHILYLAPPDDKESYQRAQKKAENALKRIHEKSDLFKVIAREESACSSSGNGGSLGQIGKGQTLPAFEDALMKMKAGELSSKPLASEVGYHIIKVHEFAEGKQLPYESVSEWISHFLENQRWQEALSAYIQVLSNKAKIKGFELNVN